MSFQGAVTHLYSSLSSAVLIARETSITHLDELQTETTATFLMSA
jgi:hypothetical protein